MSYDNSELLKNYVHAHQVFGYDFYRHIAGDIVRWMDEWLTDREHGGFYASQDADINLDDDGDYFTWTVDEAKSVLSADEFEAISLHFDIAEVGEMQHNPAKNVLWVRALADEVSTTMRRDITDVLELLAVARAKLSAARAQRPTPFIDRTIYSNWNALCVSAYLLWRTRASDARQFALRSLDRILAGLERRSPVCRMSYAYGDANVGKRFVRRLTSMTTPTP